MYVPRRIIEVCVLDVDKPDKYIMPYAVVGDLKVKSNYGNFAIVKCKGDPWPREKIKL